MSRYCEHPDDEVTITPTNSMWGGADCYCAVCGHEWYVTQKELDVIEDYILRPPLRTLDDLEEQDALAPGHTDLMVTPESIDKFLEENPLTSSPSAGEWK